MRGNRSSKPSPPSGESPLHSAQKAPFDEVRSPRWASFREQLEIFMAARSTTRLIRRDIGLSGVCSLQDLLDAVAVKRGKPITLTEAPLPPEISGFCARGSERDHIVVDSRASQLTRFHVAAHELFHLWEEHPADDTTQSPIPPAMVHQLLPGLRPEAIQRVLGRSHYDEPHERRAEMFATVMVQRHLRLSTQEHQTGYMTSALAHRRTGV